MDTFLLNMTQSFDVFLSSFFSDKYFYCFTMHFLKQYFPVFRILVIFLLSNKTWGGANIVLLSHFNIIIGKQLIKYKLLFSNIEIQRDLVYDWYFKLRMSRFNIKGLERFLYIFSISSLHTHDTIFNLTFVIYKKSWYLDLYIFSIWNYFLFLISKNDKCSINFTLMGNGWNPRNRLNLMVE